LPTTVSGTPSGDLPLATIKRTIAQELIDAMVAGGLSPKSISNYFQVVRMVFSSSVDDDGQELYPQLEKDGIGYPANKQEENNAVPASPVK
jgi:hypothetical protein